ncbi:MAG TPA: hypothetical protein VMR77_04095 [Patescibacteria group bacterium]|nr:hypothetical protein [Patescibacteria group bacterium]
MNAGRELVTEMPQKCGDCINHILRTEGGGEISTNECLAGYFNFEESTSGITGELPKTGSPRGEMPCGGEKFVQRGLYSPIISWKPRG